MKNNKKQLHEALAVLLTKLSSARDNPLLIDNYVVNALRTTLVTFKESGELHEALKEQIQTAMQSNNPWISILMKSMNINSSSKMTTRDSNGTEVPLEPISKDKLFDMMKQNGVYLDNNDNPYDAVFAANMCKADYLGSSITDEKHLCLYVKDVIDDVDGYDGIVFNRWYADMCRKGVQVDWYECR